MNTFGRFLRLTTFGESHGAALGGVLDGMPAGLPIDLGQVQTELDRRRPGTGALVSPRAERDRLEILSGVFEGRTTGTPIGLQIANEDARPQDYDALREVLRPGHADYTYLAKYGHRDHRGGGRASARETALRVAAGALARQFLATYRIGVAAWVDQIGPIGLGGHIPHEEALAARFDHPLRLPDAARAAEATAYLTTLREEGDTCGGIIAACVTGLPPGLGSPVFDKLPARLSYALMGINAAKGFEYGGGFGQAARRGSEVVDRFVADEGGAIRTPENHSGGVQGGISNGEPVTLRVAFKPVSTLMRDLETLSPEGAPARWQARGRHDPCVVPRAVPIVEGMICLVIADAMLGARLDRLSVGGVR